MPNRSHSGEYINKYFGAYIRKQRVNTSNHTVRSLAKKMGINHGYVWTVENAIRGPFLKKHWPTLIKEIPGITHKGLIEAILKTGTYPLNLSNSPQYYRTLITEFIHCLENKTLEKQDVEEILNILKKGTKKCGV